MPSLSASHARLYILLFLCCVGSANTVEVCVCVCRVFCLFYSLCPACRKLTSLSANLVGVVWILYSFSEQFETYGLWRMKQISSEVLLFLAETQSFLWTLSPIELKIQSPPLEFLQRKFKVVLLVVLVSGRHSCGISISIASHTLTTTTSWGIKRIKANSWVSGLSDT